MYLCLARLIRLTGILTLTVFLVLPAWSHKGLPVALIKEKPTKFGLLSVSVDPELGEGIFFILLNTEKASMSGNLSIQLLARASEGSEETKSIEAHRDTKLDQRGSRIGFRADVPFAHSGLWNVELTFAEGASIQEHLILPVEVVPPGPTKAESIVFVIPFLLVAFFLTKVLLRKKQEFA